jgi:hypothetical protein
MNSESNMHACSPPVNHTSSTVSVFAGKQCSEFATQIVQRHPVPADLAIIYACTGKTMASAVCWQLCFKCPPTVTRAGSSRRAGKNEERQFHVPTALPSSETGHARNTHTLSWLFNITIVQRNEILEGHSCAPSNIAHTSHHNVGH